MFKPGKIQLAILSVILSLCSIITLGQDFGGQSNKWVFGTNTIIDFNSGMPDVMEGSQMIAPAGCASLSDSVGNLLLYSNGVSIWNGNHEKIADGLYGDSTLTQGVVIIPRPGRDNQYFVFTVGNAESTQGLNYTIVDLSVGSGRVFFKNTKLMHYRNWYDAKFTEKLLAVRNFDTNKFWLVAHRWPGVEFYVYNIDENFDDFTDPMIYDGSQFNEGFLPHMPIQGSTDIYESTRGYMKASGKGWKIACVLKERGLIQLFEFNSKKGQIKYPNNIIGIEDVYGMEFSPSGDYIYACPKKPGGGGYIYQWDIRQRGDQDTINMSRKVIGTIPEGVTAGALQLGPNGKIYVAYEGEDYLGVINYPNREGTQSQYFARGVNLEGGTSGLGLPTYISKFFVRESFAFENECFGDSTYFYLTSITRPESVSWDFGDGTIIGPLDPAYSFVHYYEEPGDYLVKMTTVRPGDTNMEVSQTITIHSPAFPVDLGEDNFDMCNGDTMILDPGPGLIHTWYKNYVFEPFSDEEFLTIASTGIYAVSVADSNFCVVKDTIKLIFHDVPVVNGYSTTEAYCGESNGTATVIPQGNINNYTYLWDTPNEDITATALNLPRGIYSVEVFYKDSLSTCSNKIDTIAVTEFGAPEVYITAAKDTVCPGEALLLTAHNGESYMWIDGSTANTCTIYPKSDTTFNVIGSVVDSSGHICAAEAQIVINVYETLQPDLGGYQELCEGEEIVLDAGPADSYLWQNGSTSRLLNVNSTGTYYVTVDDGKGCLITDSTDILFSTPFEINIGADSSRCIGEEIYLDAGIGDSYLWNDTDTSRFRTITTTGTYDVVVRRKGCYAEDNIYLLFHDPDSLIIDSVAVDPVLCYGNNEGALRIYATGVTGLINYSIDGGNSWTDNGDFTGLPPESTYQVAIKETGGCQISGPEIFIDQGSEITAEAILKHTECDDCDNGKISLEISGGFPPYTYIWTNSDTTAVIENLTQGIYTVEVSDSILCKLNFSFELYPINEIVRIPTAFTPNGDGINDMWTIIPVEGEFFPNMEVNVFDHYGNKVYYHKGDLTAGWDGKSTNGSLLPVNTYYFILDLGTENLPIKGTVTIIR
ncbi:gliding motility-associated C-terminal domain-containing protein [Bacteroidota bacterium]